MAQTGYTPIQIYNSTTTGNTPSTNVQGELACNITDKKLWIGNGSSNVQLLGTGADVNADNVVAAKGVYAKTAMTATYGDGIVLDYTTGTGRFSVGSNDGFAWYNGGVANTQIASMGTDGTLNVPNTFGFKNRIINGAMAINQYSTLNTPITPIDSQITLDRWKAGLTAAGKFTSQQSSDSTTGFSYSLKATSTSAYTVGASDEFEYIYRIEGYNVADLAWGTVNAKTVTLSFWVKSSLTGTFGGNVLNSDASRCYVTSYTINSANTWEYKTITIPGDVTGTWNTTNGIGLMLFFSLGAGSSVVGAAGSWGGTFYRGVTGQTNLVANNAATWQITGVQLEKGSTATSFDYRPYGTELALCQRYYQSMSIFTPTYPTSVVVYYTTKRAAPTLASSAAGFTTVGVTPSVDSAYIAQTSAGQSTITISSEL